MAKHRSDGIGRQLLVTDAFGHELPKCSVHHGRAGNAFESASTLQMALSNQQVTRGFGDLKHISQLSSFGHRMPVSTALLGLGTAAFRTSRGCPDQRSNRIRVTECFGKV